MANQYKNKVQLSDGTVLIDISDTTAEPSDVASGKYFYTKTGEKKAGTHATGKNIQVYSGYDEVHTTSYTATDVSIKVAKAGTYKCSWIGWRSNGSGTNGSQLYVNNTAKGSAHTSFTRSYGQYCVETLALNANDTVVVRARSRGSSYYMLVGNLILEEQ